MYKNDILPLETYSIN